MDTARALRWVAAPAVAAIVAWAIPTWSDGQEHRYSGTVAVLDRSAGAILVEDEWVTVIVTPDERPPKATRIYVWDPTGDRG